MKVIQITRTVSVCPLLAIADPEFARWYRHGVFWALYGDEQGNGPYEDTYLIDNISRNIRAGRYDRFPSSWFAHTGFYIGMLHGGWLVRPSDTLVLLTDPDFARCYRQRRQDGQPFTDNTLVHTIHQWALSRVAGPALAYELGSLTGTLGRALIPAPMPAVSVQ